ncbi:MAG: hypothetical protein RMY29_008790 [Nostoc sp. CreGUA01]|nr:hypothetical protein [Nostoc sp. CreGUA01]
MLSEELGVRSYYSPPAPPAPSASPPPHLPISPSPHLPTSPSPHLLTPPCLPPQLLAPISKTIS